MERKLKDSGIPWIGQIPEEWEIIKTSRAFKGIGSGTTPTSGNPLFYTENGINWLQTGDLNDSVIFSTSKKISAKALDEFKALKIYPKGSIVIAMYGATIGKLGKLGITTATNQACCVLPYGVFVNNDFAFYVFASGKNTLINSAYGAGQPNISQDIIREFKIPVPPLEEQERIAAYLDEKCGEIDELIGIEEQMIADLEAYRQAVITEAVTHGLNPNTPLRPSGIPWIGEFPKNWKEIRLKFLTKISTGDKDTIMANPEGDYPFFVRSPKIERIDTYSYDGEAILMAGDGVGAGRVFHHFCGKFDWHQRVYNLHDLSEKIKGRYLYYFLSSNFYKLIDAGSAKSTVDSVRLPMLTNFLILVPPLFEQEEIAEYLDNKCAEIEELIRVKQEKIEALKQYRQSLIFETVTGKIDIA